MNEEICNRLKEILDYLNYLGRLNEKPVFKVDEYKQLCLWEHELKGRIGIQHNVTDKEGGTIWLRIERLKRISPPPLPKQIQEWLSVSNDPEINPQVKDKIIKTIPEKEVTKLIEQSIVKKQDVRDPLKKDNLVIKLKDVIFRLDNLPKIKEQIDAYLNEQWLPWQKKKNLVEKQ
jgi:hypothetical protein